MSRRFSFVVLPFVSLAVILHYGSQIRAKVFPEIVASPPTTAAVQATAKPSLLQTAGQVPPKTLAARSLGDHVPSQTAATASTSETPITHTTIKTLATTSLATTNSTPSASPGIRTLRSVTMPNNAHAAAGGLEATAGPHTAPASLPTAVTPPACTTGTSPLTASHTAGRATQPSDRTTPPATLSASSHSSTSSWKPVLPTHTPGRTTATRSAPQTASPAPSAPWPTLAPQPSSAKTGTYEVLNGSRLCIKAEMGIELAVQDTESVFSPQRYFSLDPNGTQASGNCGFRRSNLLLNFRGGFVNLTFTKAEKASGFFYERNGLNDSARHFAYVAILSRPMSLNNRGISLGPEQRFLDVVTTRLSKKGLIDVEDKIHILNICDYETPTVQSAEAEERTVGLEEEDSYYVSEVGAYLTVSNPDASIVSLESLDLDNKPLLSTSSAPEKIYQGMKSAVVAFEAAVGHSFKCVSKQSFQLSTRLQLKTMNVRLQAFDFEDDHFGNVDECSSDYTIVLPVIGAIVLGLCALGLIVYGIRLKRQSSGYQRI